MERHQATPPRQSAWPPRSFAFGNDAKSHCPKAQIFLAWLLNTWEHVYHYWCRLRWVSRWRHSENNLKSGSRHLKNRIRMKVSNPKPFIWFPCVIDKMERVTWHRGAPYIKLCSQYFTSVGCFAQSYRIIPIFALKKWYSNRCFVWDLSTLVKAQCGRFSRYAQLPWQKRLLPENCMPDRHQSFLSQRCFSPTNMIVCLQKL